MHLHKKGFTLVELIVVITILAILWTIAFISLQWYAKDARDSVRIQDVANIKKSLELFVTEKWFYPIPSDATDITYSWGIVWQQWTVWDSVVENLWKLNKKPVDPTLATEYSYSITNAKSEYELSWILEWGWTANTNVLNQANAATAYTALVWWNYNGQVLKVSTWGLDYFLALPSVTTSDLWITDLQTLVTNKSLVYNGEYNLPSNYSWVEWFTATGWFDYAPSELVVFKWTRDELWFSASKVELIKNLQNAYSGTLLSFKWDFTELLSFDAQTNRDSATSLALNMFDTIPQFSKNLLIPPFEPTTVSWLQLWLDGDDTYSVTKDENNKVSGWTDKSGKWNHAVQVTWDNQPEFIENGVGGKWSLVFDGTNDKLSIPNDASLNFDSGSGYTIFFVAQSSWHVDNGSSVNYFLSKWDGTFVLDGYGLLTDDFTPARSENIAFKPGSTNIAFYPSDPVEDSIKDGDFIFTAIKNNTDDTAKLYRNKKLTLETGLTGDSDNSSPFYIGGTSTTTRYAGWDYAEILVYNRPLWDSERLSIYNYLAEKWGLEFTPRHVSGLELWLDANDQRTITHSANKVSAWKDKSGNGNDALQPTESAKPVYSTTNFNGKPTLVLEGNDYMEVTLNPDLTTTALSAFVVSESNVHVISTSVLSWLASGQANDYDNEWSAPLFDEGGSNSVVRTFHYNASMSSATNLGTGVGYIANTQFDGVNNTMYINNVASPSVPTTSTLDFHTLYVGARAAGGVTARYNGKIPEILLYNRGLSAQERKTIYNYLKSKWWL